jgi:hypothetical protein
MLVAAAATALAPSSGAAEHERPMLTDIALAGADGAATRLQPIVAAHRLTVVVFFSATCPCFAVHARRLRDLAAEMAPRGVAFVVVDSERHAAAEPRPATVPGTTLPILRDEDARLARRLGAEAATESFVFDASGRLRYRGGIDDQRKVLAPNPRAYLRDALVRLLDDSASAVASTKALGCVLRLM